MWWGVACKGGEWFRCGGEWHVKLENGEDLCAWCGDLYGMDGDWCAKVWIGV